jgi:thymidylate synthase ThyX
MAFGYDSDLVSSTPTPRVLTVGPVPAEKLAYALARYSRSPDSVKESLEWVRTHDSSKFLESFYFQYGHASIADLGHLAISFEGISEIAAIEIEDEQLWDGQARSSRYQDFSKSGFVTPPELNDEQRAVYQAAGQKLMDAYRAVHGCVYEHLCAKLPKPETMKPESYERNLKARAFDVARYLLFLGVPTGVGQVTSIRTLEKQIRRLKSSEYEEIREIGMETALACAAPPACTWREEEPIEPVAPTLAKYTDPDTYGPRMKRDLTEWAEQNLPAPSSRAPEPVELTKVTDTLAGLAATLLYPVTDRPFAELFAMALDWSEARRGEVVDVALRSKTRRDEMAREFRGGEYAYDLLIDIGAYRDFHRHRRCHQFRQAFSWRHGFDSPAAVDESGAGSLYRGALEDARQAAAQLPEAASHYLLPFAARSRFLFRMDFAEVEYISRLRSGVKGHFSYRDVAWRMKLELEKIEPQLARLIEATPPWIEDPLVR